MPPLPLIFEQQQQQRQRTRENLLALASQAIIYVEDLHPDGLPVTVAKRAADGSWCYEKLPSELFNFYYKRYDLFPEFDKGVLLDEESWYSVTPHRLARSDLPSAAFHPLTSRHVSSRRDLYPALLLYAFLINTI